MRKDRKYKKTKMLKMNIQLFANSVALVTKYVPLLDEVYKTASVTSIIDGETKPSFDGANAVKIFKTALQGLGTYSRNAGFTAGDVTATWETMTLSQDRGRSFMMDNMDNDETAGLAFGTLASEFVRTKVAPELDAYRFAKYCGVSGISTVAAASLATSANVLAAIDAAIVTLDEAEVPAEGRVLFITPTKYGLLKGSAAVTRFATMSDGSLNRDFEYFDNMKVVKVPQTRFYTGITMVADTAGGYTKALTGETGPGDDVGLNINFMIIHPSAVVQAVKVAQPRVFTPEQNQTADAYKYDFRLYHDAFGLENKAVGIYLHKHTS